MLPFSRDALFSLFEQYNAAIWPAQVVAWALGAVALGLVLWPVRGSDRAVAALLAPAWLWTGAVFHAGHFARINFWAYGFAALFLLQGLLFGAAALRGRPAWRFRAGPSGWTGLALAGLALAAPLLGWAAGWPRTALFGLTPGPVALFTWGMLLMAAPRPPIHLAVVPLAWFLIASLSALALGMPEDLPLLLPAALALVVIGAQWRVRAR